jgi:hypothetical protein
MLANPDDHGTDTGDETVAPSEPGFLPSEPGRRQSESALVRIVATAGIVGIGTALGAILGAGDLAGWIIGLVVALISVLLAAVLWRSRTL